MGYSFAKFPHAYWKKFAHGSALESINCLSRPGSNTGTFSVSSEAALACMPKVSEAAMPIRTAAIHVCFLIVLPDSNCSIYTRPVWPRPAARVNDMYAGNLQET